MDFISQLVVQTEVDKKLTAIAAKHVPQLRNRRDLKQRYKDDDDFFETAVWVLKEMLMEAYKLGQIDRGYTTMELLRNHVSPANGIVMRYADRVFVSDVIPEGGFYAIVYRFVSKPKPDERDLAQKRLALKAVAETAFTDSGHAIEWCFSQK